MHTPLCKTRELSCALRCARFGAAGYWTEARRNSPSGPSRRSLNSSSPREASPLRLPGSTRDAPPRTLDARAELRRLRGEDQAAASPAGRGEEGGTGESAAARDAG